MSTTSMKRIAISGVAALILAAGANARADDDTRARGGLFEVTVTNLTRGQQFTPILVATHQAGVKLFQLGEPASPALQAVAEEGNIAPLTAALQAMPGVLDVSSSGALLAPGESVTIQVRTRGAFDHVSVASMLIPTNDAFFAVNGVRIPHGRKSKTLHSVAYDSGSERNDELCSSIPGPYFAECGGDRPSARDVLLWSPQTGSEHRAREGRRIHLHRRAAGPRRACSQRSTSRNSATRARWPPDSVAGSRSPKPSSPTAARAAATIRLRSTRGAAERASPKATLPATLR